MNGLASETRVHKIPEITCNKFSEFDSRQTLRNDLFDDKKIITLSKTTRIVNTNHKVFK